MVVMADAIAVVKLARDILDGCNEIHASATEIKNKCDRFGVSGLRDDSFESVYRSLEVAADGYKLVASSLISSSEAMIAFSDRIVKGKAALSIPLDR